MIVERSKGIEGKTDKCRDGEMRDLDIEKGSQKAGKTKMTLERNKLLKIKKKKKGSAGQGQRRRIKGGMGVESQI